MMNRWNCRPKQKRGKSKRAERSIGFSPLIPAKQVHTGGNPFFISVTDIHTVSFGNKHTKSNGLSRRNNRLRVRLQVFYEMIGCLVPIFPVHELVVAIQV